MIATDRLLRRPMRAGDVDKLLGVFADPAVMATFGVDHLPRLVSLIRAGNVASRRVAENFGMHYEVDIQRYDQPYWVSTLNRSQFAPTNSTTRQSLGSDEGRCGAGSITGGNSRAMVSIPRRSE